MPLKLPPKPAGAVRKHGKVFHLHHGVKMHVSAVRIDRRVGKRVISTRVGTLCPICGFQGNDVDRERARQMLDRVLDLEG